MSKPEIPSQREPLTARQHQVWKFVRDFIEMHGYPPSAREIGDGVGLSSTSSVHHHLTALKANGWLREHPKSRTRANAVAVLEDEELIPIRLTRAEWADVKRGLGDFWPATVGPLFEALERMDLGDAA